MPLPKPKAGEKQADFVSRCMTNPTVRTEFPNEEQRLAVCYDIYRKK